MTKSGFLVSALYLVSLDSPTIGKDVSGSQLACLSILESISTVSAGLFFIYLHDASG